MQHAVSGPGNVMYSSWFGLFITKCISPNSGQMLISPLYTEEETGDRDSFLDERLNSWSTLGHRKSLKMVVSKVGPVTYGRGQERSNQWWGGVFCRQQTLHGWPIPCRALSHTPFKNVFTTVHCWCTEVCIWNLCKFHGTCHLHLRHFPLMCSSKMDLSC